MGSLILNYRFVYILYFILFQMRHLIFIYCFAYIFIQHRYYGDSLPDLVGDPSNPIIKTSTFGYLTSEQALADYATVITDFKKNLSAENSPVIVFGASYAGSK